MKVTVDHCWMIWETEIVLQQEYLMESVSVKEMLPRYQSLTLARGHVPSSRM